jgi:hypothetical protein
LVCQANHYNQPKLHKNVNHKQKQQDWRNKPAINATPALAVQLALVSFEAPPLKSTKTANAYDENTTKLVRCKRFDRRKKRFTAESKAVVCVTTSAAPPPPAAPAPVAEPPNATITESAPVSSRNNYMSKAITKQTNKQNDTL